MDRPARRTRGPCVQIVPLFCMILSRVAGKSGQEDIHFFWSFEGIPKPDPNRVQDGSGAARDGNHSGFPAP